MELILVMAITADGKIARHNTHFPDWTCSEDKRMFRQVTQDAGVVIMGSRTFSTIGRALPKRLNVVMTRQPQRYPSTEGTVFTADPPEKIVSDLSRQGYEKAALIGGEIINDLFAQAGLITDLVITIAPKLFGAGLSLFSNAVDMDLRLVSASEMDADHMMLRYQVVSP